MKTTAEAGHGQASTPSPPHSNRETPRRRRRGRLSSGAHAASRLNARRHQKTKRARNAATRSDGDEPHPSPPTHGRRPITDPEFPKHCCASAARLPSAEGHPRLAGERGKRKRASKQKPLPALGPQRNGTPHPNLPTPVPKVQATSTRRGPQARPRGRQSQCHSNEWQAGSPQHHRQGRSKSRPSP